MEINLDKGQGIAPWYFVNENKYIYLKKNDKLSQILKVDSITSFS